VLFSDSVGFFGPPVKLLARNLTRLKKVGLINQESLPKGGFRKRKSVAIHPHRYVWGVGTVGGARKPIFQRGCPERIGSNQNFPNKVSQDCVKP
jgi:hypothetical protein